MAADVKAATVEGYFGGRPESVVIARREGHARLSSPSIVASVHPYRIHPAERPQGRGAIVFNEFVRLAQSCTQETNPRGIGGLQAPSHPAKHSNPGTYSLAD